MEKFELKVDINTPYMKVIQFIGVLGLGFFIGSIFFTLKFDGDVDWMNSATGIMCNLFLAFYPEAVKKHTLTIDDKGIFLHNYTFHRGRKNEITWEKINGIGIHKKAIQIRNSIGSTEKIQLPIHTKNQLEELRSYLEKVAQVKEVEYIK
jgi:hypothetical protein